MTIQQGPSPIARAIDLGHGNVKLTRNAAGGVLECFEFPAMALPALSGEFTVDNLPMARTNTVIAEVNQRLYYVGPDTVSMQQAMGGRELDPGYARGERYAALMKGALAYVNEPVIDVLVLGLPLSTFEREHARLAQVWKGRFEVPLATNPKGRRYVEVRHVVMVPQPIGAYVHAVDVKKIRPSTGSTLIIDPGYFTLDWVVMTENQAIVHGRSGALQGGMSSLVRILATRLEKDVGRPIQSTSTIEKAWRNQEPVVLYGRTYQLSSYVAPVQSAVESMVADLVGRLGDHADIRQVVVAGGGARMFEQALRAKLGTDVAVLDDPQFANLRGFQAIGERFRATASAAAGATA